MEQRFDDMTDSEREDRVFEIWNQTLVDPGVTEEPRAGWRRISKEQQAKNFGRGAARPEPSRQRSPMNRRGGTAGPQRAPRFLQTREECLLEVTSPHSRCRIFNISGLRSPLRLTRHRPRDPRRHLSVLDGCHQVRRARTETPANRPVRAATPATVVNDPRLEQFPQPSPHQPGRVAAHPLRRTIPLMRDRTRRIQRDSDASGARSDRVEAARAPMPGDQSPTI